MQPVTVIEANRSGILAEIRESWRYRELLGFLAWRDIRVRYRHTFVGFAWALIEPFLTVVAFTLLFNRIAGIESADIPYPLYCYAAMLVWNFFARALRDSTTSFVTNATLVRKVYFPRLVLPTACIVAAGVDFACALVMYGAMLLYYGITPTWAILTLPFWVALAAFNALGVGLALAAINVRFRDITQALPFLLQLWLLATPIAYPLQSVPASWLGWYLLNPLVAVAQGMRWALLPESTVTTVDPQLLVTSVCINALLLWAGLRVFQRSQKGFADVI